MTRAEYEEILEAARHIVREGYLNHKIDGFEMKYMLDKLDEKERKYAAAMGIAMSQQGMKDPADHGQPARRGEVWSSKKHAFTEDTRNGAATQSIRKAE